MSRGVLKSGERIPGLLRFGSVGAVATLAYVAAYALLQLVLSIEPIRASALAYGAGMAVSWVGQSRWTFGRSSVARDSLPKFVALSLVGLSVATGTVWFADSLLGISPIWGAVVTCGLIPLASFAIMNLWVFVAGPEQTRAR